MKHEALLKEILSEMRREWWMDDADKAAYDAEMMQTHGAGFDADVDESLARGCTIEQFKASFLAALNNK